MRRTIAVLLAVGAILVEPTLARAQGPAGQWSASVRDAGEISLEIGIEGYREGALEVAVEALSDALESRLGDRQRAEALYYRGLAYRELHKPGQAVLDFSSAIAVKNGLSKPRLKDAVKNRDEAAREAGISKSETVLSKDASTNASRTAVPVPAHRLPVPDEAPRQASAQPPTAALPGPPQQPPAVVQGAAPSKSGAGFLPSLSDLIPSLF